MVNPASLRGVGIVSDDIEAMPDFQNEEDAPLGWDSDHDGIEGSGEDLRVTFLDGTSESYALSEGVANDVYSFLIGNEFGEGCFLSVQDDEAGHYRSFINMAHIAMLDLPAELFASLTSDDDVDINDEG
jgi:hypothetical protein